MCGIFDDMFDFDNDGKLDDFEKAMELDYMEKLDREISGDGFDSDDNDDDLEFAGLDRDELEWMDADERNEVLEEAGLDPDDFDF